MASGAVRTARKHGSGAEVAMAVRLGDGEGKSERGRAREWEWERAAAALPFTPSVGQIGWVDAGERPPFGACGLVAVGHDPLRRPIQIGHQAD